MISTTHHIELPNSLGDHTYTDIWETNKLTLHSSLCLFLLANHIIIITINAYTAYLLSVVGLRAPPLSVHKQHSASSTLLVHL